MRALKMLPGDPHPIENPVWIEKLVDVLAEGPGIWYPLVKRGTYVSAGTKLGTITDYVGKVIAEPRAPVSAIVLHVNAVPSLKKGDNIADLGVLASHAPYPQHPRSFRTEHPPFSSPSPPSHPSASRSDHSP